MQTLTRNPLADPGLLGSTPAPASPSSSARRCSGSLPAGAAAAGVLRRALRLAAGSLYRQPGGGQLSPVRLTRRGRPCGGTRGAVQRHRPAQPGRLRSATLLAGRFAGYPHPANAENCPAAGSGGGIAALLLSRALNSLSPGNDTATALGSRVARTQLIGLIVITVLCAAPRRRRPHRLYRPDDAAYGALAGGADHRWSLPVTLLATPALLLFADVIGRLLVPGELRVSVVSAFGAPVLIWLVRRQPREVACDCSVPPPDSQLSAADGRQPADFPARAGARPGAPDD